ncbi:TIGR04104 family putative zinc finger protein [Virgibacillus salexigens]|uniref:TIGR04104 family putative zinc finger protein n=1 Tax=Virgibacillus salexigens TaxID=61016 RepID=UPI00190E1D71|nr:TIGR04104 family putative zinc finger protein [Virgibacillus salexigens]
MPTCENCNNKWSWKQTIKKTATLDSAITCPYCGEKQYQTQKSKTKCALLTPVILLPMLLNFFFEPGIHVPILLAVLFLLAMSLFPFLVEIGNKEEYINFFDK